MQAIRNIEYQGVKPIYPVSQTRIEERRIVIAEHDNALELLEAILAMNGIRIEGSEKLAEDLVNQPDASIRLQLMDIINGQRMDLTIDRGDSSETNTRMQSFGSLPYSYLTLVQ